GETNSVSFQFSRVGQVTYPATAGSADAMLEAAIEAGAEDAESDEDEHRILCAIDDLAVIRDALEAKFGPANSAKLVWRPQTLVPVGEEEAAQALFRLV